MPSGTAVSASAELCSASPSSATEPDSATTTACASAVAARAASEIHKTRRPSAEDSSTGSTARSCEWECGPTACRRRAQIPR